MAIETPWQRWFAWRPVRDHDGFWHWLGYVERCRVIESEVLSADAAPSISIWWKYRTYWPVDHGGS